MGSLLFAYVCCFPQKKNDDKKLDQANVMKIILGGCETISFVLKPLLSTSLFHTTNQYYLNFTSRSIRIMQLCTRQFIEMRCLIAEAAW